MTKDQRPRNMDLAPRWLVALTVFFIGLYLITATIAVSYRDWIEVAVFTGVSAGLVWSLVRRVDEPGE